MTDREAAFLQRFVAGLIANTHRVATGNTDDWRYSELAAERGKRQWREALLSFADRLGWHRRRFNPRHVERELTAILPHVEGFTRSFARWADDASRELMLELLWYRVLGPGHVKLSINTSEYWQARARVEERCVRRRDVERVGNLVLDEFEIPGQEGTIRSIQRPAGVATTFFVEQYALRRAGVEVAAAPGDVALDCGGCWGDTALYFADRVGAHGRVFSFEFDHANAAVFDRNLAANPHLAPRIERVPHPLWSCSGQEMRFSSAGPGTRLGAGGAGENVVKTLTIDDLVAQRGLERLDFIKMDIEGAELPALEGARDTLRRFRPKLAICAYHKIDDFVTLPDFLESLGCGYRLWLAHSTIHLEESVVFAAP